MMNIRNLQKLVGMMRMMDQEMLGEIGAHKRNVVVGEIE